MAVNDINDGCILFICASFRALVLYIMAHWDTWRKVNNIIYTCACPFLNLFLVFFFSFVIVTFSCILFFVLICTSKCKEHWLELNVLYMKKMPCLALYWFKRIILISIWPRYFYIWTDICLNSWYLANKLVCKSKLNHYFTNPTTLINVVTEWTTCCTWKG